MAHSGLYLWSIGWVIMNNELRGTWQTLVMVCTKIKLKLHNLNIGTELNHREPHSEHPNCGTKMEPQFRNIYHSSLEINALLICVSELNKDDFWERVFLPPAFDSFK